MIVEVKCSYSGSAAEYAKGMVQHSKRPANRPVVNRCHACSGYLVFALAALNPYDAELA